MATWMDLVKNEFHPKNFGLNTDPKFFLKSQWPCIKTHHYTAYRMAIALLFPVWIVVDLVVESNFYHNGITALWLIFATNWGFILLAGSAILHATLCIVYHVFAKNISKRDEEGYLQSPWPMKLFWAIFNMAANSAVVISISYYAFLAIFDHRDFISGPSSYTKHSLNTIYVLLDLMITAVPIRLLHIIYTFMLATAYILFNVIFFSSNGRGPDGDPYVYYMMDWKKPGKAIITIVEEILLSLLVQVLLWLYYRARLKMYDRFCKSDVALYDDTKESTTLTATDAPSNYNAVQENVELDNNDKIVSE